MCFSARRFRLACFRGVKAISLAMWPGAGVNCRYGRRSAIGSIYGEAVRGLGLQCLRVGPSQSQDDKGEIQAARRRGGGVPSSSMREASRTQEPDPWGHELAHSANRMRVLASHISVAGIATTPTALQLRCSAATPRTPARDRCRIRPHWQRPAGPPESWRCGRTWYGPQR